MATIDDYNHGILLRSAALEATWCEVDSDGQPVWETAPIMQVGIHKGNRGGVYIQGETCVTLVQTIIQAGFLNSEANYRGVAVRVGHHCAWPTCRRYGVPATTRLSTYLYNNTDDIDAAAAGIRAAQEFFGVA